MLRSRIIPVLLLHDGGLVKSYKFKDYNYIGDPINAVKIFSEMGVDELIIFDIDASARGCQPDYHLLSAISSQCRIPLCYGGGIRSLEQATRIINLGFEKVSISSAAINNPSLLQSISNVLGRQSVVLTLDIKRESFSEKYSAFTINGKLRQPIDVLDFCRFAEELGVGEISINCIDNDGEMNGYDIGFALTLRNYVSVPITILGGAGSISDIQLLIDNVGVVGAAASSIFVYNGQQRSVLINYSRPIRLF